MKEKKIKQNKLSEASFIILSNRSIHPPFNLFFSICSLSLSVFRYFIHSFVYALNFTPLGVCHVSIFIAPLPPIISSLPIVIHDFSVGFFIHHLLQLFYFSS